MMLSFCFQIFFFRNSVAKGWRVKITKRWWQSLWSSLYNDLLKDDNEDYDQQLRYYGWTLNLDGMEEKVQPQGRDLRKYTKFQIAD